MPVSIIENWSDIVGEVRQMRPEVDVPGFTCVEMDVRRVEGVEGFANLLEDAVGKRLAVYFPAYRVVELGILVGSVVACRVRRAGIDRIYVHREHIEVIPRGEGVGQEDSE